MRYLMLGVILMLQGCFFVYLPGSVVGGIGDALRGEYGQHCVVSSAQVGDRIRLPDGSIRTVTGISGVSSRCPGDRVRAELN